MQSFCDQPHLAKSDRTSKQHWLCSWLRSCMATELTNSKFIVLITRRSCKLKDLGLLLTTFESAKQ